MSRVGVQTLLPNMLGNLTLHANGVGDSLKSRLVNELHKLWWAHQWTLRNLAEIGWWYQWRMTGIYVYIDFEATVLMVRNLKGSNWSSHATRLAFSLYFSYLARQSMRFRGCNSLMIYPLFIFLCGKESPMRFSHAKPPVLACWPNLFTILMSRQTHTAAI